MKLSARKWTQMNRGSREEGESKEKKVQAAEGKSWIEYKQFSVHTQVKFNHQINE